MRKQTDAKDETWTFPRRSFELNPKDAASITVSSDRDGNVHIMFGKEVTWFAMPAKQAIEIAKLILHHAGVKKMKVVQ
jgi:hypothetical protein